MAPIQIDDHQTSSKLLQINSDDRNPMRTSPPRLLFSKRLLVTLMLFFCYVNFQTLKHNINIAVVDMTSNKSFGRTNGTHLVAEFDWDTKVVGVVSSVISYGGALAFLSGFVIDWLGGSVTCALCMFLSGITTMLHAPALQLSFHLFLVCRFVTGLVEAAFYVSAAEISTRWYPKKERTTLIGLGFNGVNVGAAISYPFCGYITHRWGWRMVFYVTGAISVATAIFLRIMIPNRPSQDKFISKKELAYILDETDDVNNEKIDQSGGKKRSYILKRMVTSSAFWALFVGQFSFMWLNTTLTANLPQYIHDLTHKDSDEIGYITSIPTMVYIFMFPICGALIDCWKNHTSITMTRIHKILLGLSFVLASILFVACTYISDFNLSIAVFVLIQFFLSVVPLILSLIIVTLAPQYTSHVASLSSIFFSLGTVASQTITGFMVTNHSIQEWNNTFLLTACISVISALIFIVCGSSESQKWSL